jgi:hypothetical protein
MHHDFYRPTGRFWQPYPPGPVTLCLREILRLFKLRQRSDPAARSPKTGALRTRLPALQSLSRSLESAANITAFTMKKFLTLALSLALVSVSFAEEDDSSKEIRNTSVVESGTYQVTAKRVDPEEKEIYVTMEDGKVLELYFSDATKLTQGGKDVAFDALKKGQKLEVQVEKDGAKLKPIAVTILD